VKFKPGDRVVCQIDGPATVCEWSSKMKRKPGEVAIQYDNVIENFYEQSFPHNWIDEKKLRPMTKLEKSLK